MKYFHQSNLLDFFFRSGFWQTFDTIFVRFCSFEKNGPSFQLDSPWLRTRHGQIGVERSSAVSSYYRQKWNNRIEFTFVFPTRNAKQQMAAGSVGRTKPFTKNRHVTLQFNWRMGKFRRTSSSETVDH